MTQVKRWLVRYKEVKSFVENNKCRPFKYAPEERNAWNWLRHTQKQYNAGEVNLERVEDFKKLIRLCEEKRHIKQYFDRNDNIPIKSCIW